MGRLKELLGGLHEYLPRLSWVLWGFLAIGVAGPIWFMLWWPNTLVQTTGDRLAWLGDTIGLEAWVLALIAAIVAVLTYQIATGQPDLHVGLLFFPYSEANQPRLCKNRHGRAGGGLAIWEGHHNARVIVSNRSRYTARNPVVSIQLRNLRVSDGGFVSDAGWFIVPAIEGEPMFIRWEGNSRGRTTDIHGGDRVLLPPLPLPALSAEPQGPYSIEVRVMSEGYSPRPVTIPVQVLTPKAWVNGDPERLGALSDLLKEDARTGP